MTSPTLIPVIVRSRNEKPFAEATLRALREQTLPVHVIAFDNDSTDGTREIMDRLADDVVRVPAGSYIPGRVLNSAMLRSRGELVVFLNADCTPLDAYWLENLLAVMEDSSVAAAFSRQIPRRDCHPLYAIDTHRFYGNGSKQNQARHLFSMASSVVRRSAWQSFPFDSELRYSEDIHWTWRAKQRGLGIRYAPQSMVFHSHNYSLRELFKRHRGEGQAEAEIFDWSSWQRSLLRYSVLPWGRQVVDDWRYCSHRGYWRAACRSPLHRAVQAFGRRQGFATGLRELGEGRAA